MSQGFCLPNRLAAVGTLTALVGGLPLSYAADADTHSDDATLQEIIVTAQRKSENAQNVPIAMQVVTGAQMAQANESSLETLSETVPNVHVGTGTGRSSDLYIRGIGSADGQSFDQSVGVFIDDIFYGRSRGSAATFLDVNRVEVLKGPQSTYFGNNAIAGALNIVTNKPTDSFDADARILYGQFNQYAFEGAVGGPLNDVLSVRVAVGGNGDTGFLYDTSTRHHVPEDINTAGRVTLLYKPNETFDLTLKGEASDNRDLGAGGTFEQVANCPPPAPFPAAGFCQGIIAQHLPVGTNNRLTAFPGGMGDTFDSPVYVMTANWRQWNQVLTSVTGYYNYHYVIDQGLSETSNDAPAVFTDNGPERYSQLSQELRITSGGDDALSYLAGVYFQTDELHFAQDFNYFFLGLPPPTGPLGSESDYQQSEHEYSAFGSLTWKVTDALRLTAGLRGTYDNKNYNLETFYGNAAQEYGGIVPFTGDLCTVNTPATGMQAALAGSGLGAACAFSGSRRDHAWLPSAKIQYALNPDAMAYFSYSKGFKAGGFNGGDTSGNIANIPFQPEYVQSYEIGLKSQWFDNQLLFNIDAFRSNYSNLQVSYVLVGSAGGAIQAVVRNAAASRSEGIEMETRWLINRHFDVSANASYLHAYYQSYARAGLTTLGTFCSDSANQTNTACVSAFGPSGNPGEFQDLSGRPTPFSPRWSASIAATYTTPITDRMRFKAQLSPYVTSGYFLSGDGTDDPYEFQNAYIRLDGALSLELADHWTFDFIGKNLTDRVILNAAIQYPAALGSFIYSREMPRNVAAQVRYQW